tara:strand:+ start:193 stop:1074 length:882 start_codon:yes stop_codon:yes gene_type:complete
VEQGSIYDGTEQFPSLAHPCDNCGKLAPLNTQLQHPAKPTSQSFPIEPNEEYIQQMTFKDSVLMGELYEWLINRSQMERNAAWTKASEISDTINSLDNKGIFSISDLPSISGDILAQTIEDHSLGDNIHLKTFQTFMANRNFDPNLRDALNPRNPDPPRDPEPLAPLVGSCTKCKAEVNEGTRFCNACGTETDTDTRYPNWRLGDHEPLGWFFGHLFIIAVASAFYQGNILPIMHIAIVAGPIILIICIRYYWTLPENHIVRNVWGARKILMCHMAFGLYWTVVGFLGLAGYL